MTRNTRSLEQVLPREPERELALCRVGALTQTFLLFKPLSCNALLDARTLI